MKIIPAGTRKIVLIDKDAIERNTTRRAGRTEKILRVIVNDETGPAQILKANTVRFSGVSNIEYSQHGFVAGNQRAAITTTDELVLDETETAEGEPSVDPQADASAPATAPKADKSKANNNKKDKTA